MELTLDNEMIIDAIIGRGFKTYEIAGKMTEIGLARFTGNQWNEEWKWNKNELEKLTFIELKKLYISIK